MKIPLEKLRLNLNPRTQVAEPQIRSLASNLALVGQIHAILVIRTPEGFEVVAGKRRVLAAKLLEWKEIEAHVVDAERSDACAISLSENLHRAAMSPLDVADALEFYCTEKKMSQTEAAAALGISKSMASRFLDMRSTLTEGAAAMLQGQGPSRHFLVAMAPPDKQLELAHEIIEHDLTREAIQTRLKSFKEKKAPQVRIQVKTASNYRALMGELRNLVKKLRALERQGVPESELPKIL